jgi:hypothetical protein
MYKCHTWFKNECEACRNIFNTLIKDKRWCNHPSCKKAILKYDEITRQKIAQVVVRSRKVARQVLSVGRVSKK